jgi:hypothetical protein
MHAAALHGHHRERLLVKCKHTLVHPFAQQSRSMESQGLGVDASASTVHRLSLREMPGWCVPDELFRIAVAAPVTSYLVPGNVPVARGATLTLSGDNFGSRTSALTAYADALPCDASTWVSSTSLLCAAPSGFGPTTRRSSVVVFGIVGTGADVVYDSPTASPTPLPTASPTPLPTLAPHSQHPRR